MRVFKGGKDLILACRFGEAAGDLPKDMGRVKAENSCLLEILNILTPR